MELQHKAHHVSALAIVAVIWAATAAAQRQGPGHAPLQHYRRENTAFVLLLTTVDVNRVTINPYERKSGFVLVFECFNLFYSSVTNNLPLNVATIPIILTPEQSLMI